MRRQGPGRNPIHHDPFRRFRPLDRVTPASVDLDLGACPPRRDRYLRAREADPETPLYLSPRGRLPRQRRSAQTPPSRRSPVNRSHLSLQRWPASLEPRIVKLVTLDPRRSPRPRTDAIAHRSPPLAVTVERLGRTTVLVMDGDLDLNTAPTARQAIESALSHRPRRLIVDLSLVRFLNSTGLEVLLAAHRQATPHTDLRLVASTRAVWRPLQITRLHEHLVIHDSRSAAIASPARTGDDGESGTHCLFHQAEPRQEKARRSRSVVRPPGEECGGDLTT
ncbi:STAS domain-containing protein [Amycolatopsis sp. lyj-108]|uniref:STAS domain-containing protein n=1 Tax=Amycolatopsis sp. lyj-108 TaxID=2789286 RepID=UPI003977F915